MKRTNIVNLKDISLCMTLIMLSAGMAFFPAEVSDAVRETVLNCLNILIPSLFSFMAVGSMLSKSGSAALITKPLKPVYHCIFRMPENIFTAFLLSMIAGYPVGIKMISDMLERGDIDPETAEKSACFCYCGGPAFFSGAIGLTVFGNKKVGVLIFLSVLITNIMLALVVCRTSELHEKHLCSKCCKGNILVDGVQSAGRSMALICITVIFFSAVMSVLDASGVIGIIRRIFSLSDNEIVIVSSFIEITSLSELSGVPYKLLPWICASCSFGGLCIIIQLYALKSDKLSLFRFIELRPFAAVLSALLCKILQPLFINEAVPALAMNKSLFKVNNFAASICLILMIFLLNYKKGLVFSE